MTNGIYTIVPMIAFIYGLVLGISIERSSNRAEARRKSEVSRVGQ